MAVAWTGSRLRAQQLLPDLQKHIRKAGVRDDVLASFLADYRFRINAGGELRLIGWIAEGAPRPFWWSNLGGAVYFDELDVEGCGAELFQQVDADTHMSADGGGLSRIEEAYVVSLAKVAKLLTAETRSGLPLQNGFGFCYDIVVWCDYRFKHIPSYTQVNMDFTFNSRNGGGRFAYGSPMLIYKSLGQSAAFSAIRWSQEQNSDNSFSTSGTDPIVIPPVWACAEQAPQEKPRFHSKYICAFLNVIDEQGRSFVGPFCITDTASRGDGMWLSKRGSKEVLEFDTAVIARMHAAIFGNAAVSA